MQRSSRCFAEPGPHQTPASVTAPALQRTASQELRHSASKTRVNALMALRPGHICSIFPKTHNAARRNMIAGGAAYGYWALKSPVSIRPRELEKGSTIGPRRNYLRADGVNRHLIDSPDFHGLSSPPRCGRFLSQPAGDFTLAAAIRSEASPSPGRI